MNLHWLLKNFFLKWLLKLGIKILLYDTHLVNKLLWDESRLINHLLILALKCIWIQDLTHRYSLGDLYIPLYYLRALIEIYVWFDIIYSLYHFYMVVKLILCIIDIHSLFTSFEINVLDVHWFSYCLVRDGQFLIIVRHIELRG